MRGSQWEDREVAGFSCSALTPPRHTQVPTRAERSWERTQEGTGGEETRIFHLFRHIS